MAINARKRIQFLLGYILVKDSDIILDVGGNTGKITEGMQEIAKRSLFWSQNRRLQTMEDYIDHI